MQIFDFISLGWDFIVCISDKFPGDANIAGHEPARLQTVNSIQELQAKATIRNTKTLKIQWKLNQELF